MAIKRVTNTTDFDTGKAAISLRTIGGRLHYVVQFEQGPTWKGWADQAITDPDKVTKLNARLDDIVAAALAGLAATDPPAPR